MAINRLSYVSCDECGGHPAQPGDGAEEARGIARREGYTRVASRDICGRCSGTVDEGGWPLDRRTGQRLT